ncbi:proteasome assembly chaperone 2 [Citrus sinensis]|nr:proteasome assembly chaperone 2 [Citrus sinensis]
MFEVQTKSHKSVKLLELLPSLFKMEFVLEEGKHLSESCSNLILPALSIGNVGQLAVDLLVSSTGAETVGYLDDQFVLPCVGNDAYRPSPRGGLALPLQAYESSSSGLTLIQQRSPVVKGMMVEYAKNLADFAAASGNKHVVVLSALDFGRLQRIDMSSEPCIFKMSYVSFLGHFSGPQIYYLSSTSVDGTDDYCEQLGWKRLQEYNPAQRGWKYLSSLAEGDVGDENNFTFEDDLEEEDYYPSLPFAALFSCFKARGLKVTCLLCYCSEGDNMADAFNLADAACKFLRLNPDNLRGDDGEKWIVPFSWMTVYGPPPDMSIDAGGFAGINPPMPKLAQGVYGKTPFSPRFRLPFIPPFSGSGSPSWDSNCYIVGKRGSRVSFNGSGKNATTAILWDRVPASLGMSAGSPTCSAHITLAEAIRAGAEIVAWPT